MTTADLAVWFSRPYPTVRGWLEGYEPWGPNGERAYELLADLEWAIKNKFWMPVPISLPPRNRRAHMIAARHENARRNRIPRTRAAE